MQQCLQQCGRRGVGIGGAEQLEHQHRMLRHRKGIIALGLPVPASHARQAMGNVAQFHIDWRGIENIETATRQHTLPGAGALA
ncbi:hypothetical protein D3C87_1794620 [compost metagenome]